MKLSLVNQRQFFYGVFCALCVKHSVNRKTIYIPFQNKIKR